MAGSLCHADREMFKCLRVVIAMMKYHDQRQVGAKRVYLAYTSIL